MAVQEGDMAPDIHGIDQNGNEVKMADFAGKKVVLYFYPKDDTPGCTAEACNLRDNYSDLQKRGFEVVGVSKDPVKKHEKFVNKYDLPFTLLADEDRKVIEAYGAWGKKKFMGREYEGIHRYTFVIDEDGKVIKKIEKVKTKDHTAQILSELGIE